MNSKNKPAQAADEAAYVAIVKQMDCAVCGATGPSDAHEPIQGAWHIAIPLCRPCHGGPGHPDGWHGTRNRWKLRKMDMLQAIADTVRAVFRIITERPPMRVSTRRAIQTPDKPTKLGRPDKIAPRREYTDAA